MFQVFNMTKKQNRLIELKQEIPQLKEIHCKSDEICIFKFPVKTENCASFSSL